SWTPVTLVCEPDDSGFVEGTFASQICEGRISAVSLLLRVGDVNYIAGLSVEVMALQGDAEGFSTKRSNNGRFRATMWPPAASNHPSTAYAATVEICDRRHLT